MDTSIKWMLLFGGALLPFVVAVLLEHYVMRRYGWTFAGLIRAVRRGGKYHQTSIATELLTLPKTRRRRLALLWEKNESWLQSFWALETRHERKLEDEWRYTASDVYDVRLLQHEGLPGDVVLSRQGQVHDVFGLLDRPDFRLIQQLQFFGVIPYELNRTEAERELRWCMESKINRHRWANRPIDPIQKSLLKILGRKESANMRAVDAQRWLDSLIADPATSKGFKREHILAFECIYTEITSLRLCTSFGLRPPKPETVLEAFQSLLQEGHEAMSLFLQMGRVVERVLILDPSLAQPVAGKKRKN